MQMKVGIVLHREEVTVFEELIHNELVTVVKRKGLLCEVECGCYPMVKAKLGRSVVMPTSYGIYDKTGFD
jgi:hypothetical protein